MKELGVGGFRAPHGRRLEVSTAHMRASTSNARGGFSSVLSQRSSTAQWRLRRTGERAERWWWWVSGKGKRSFPHRQSLQRIRGDNTWAMWSEWCAWSIGKGGVARWSNWDSMGARSWHARSLALAIWPGGPRAIKNRWPGTVELGQVQLKDFYDYSNIPNGLKSLNFKNIKLYVPDVQNFPYLAWWYIISNGTNFLFGLTSKSLCILNFKFQEQIQIETCLNFKGLQS
jgi:hypothetical protein